MRQPPQPLQNAENRRNRDILAVTEMDTFQRVVAIHKTIDGLIGQVDDFDKADTAKFGHVVGDLGDGKIGEIGTACNVDIAKTGAGAGEMGDGTIGDVGDVA